MYFSAGDLGGSGGGGMSDPFESYMPEPGSVQTLPRVSEALAKNTLESNVTDLAREDEAGFMDKVARFGDGAWDGLKFGWNFGAQEQAYRAWRTLGLLLGSEDMQQTATEGLDSLKADPDRALALADLSDPIKRQAFEGMSSVIPSLATAIPGIIAGLATGGVGWVPAIVAAISAGGSGGLAEYDAFIEGAHEENKRSNPYATLEDTRNTFSDAATMSAFAEGGMDAVMNVVGAKMAKAVAKPLASVGEGQLMSVTDVFNRNRFGRLLKNTFVTGPMSEVPSEMATAAAQDRIKEIYGLDHVGMAAAAQSAIVPALLASFPFGLAQGIMAEPSANAQNLNARELALAHNEKIREANTFVRSNEINELMAKPEISMFVEAVRTNPDGAFVNKDTGETMTGETLLTTPQFKEVRDKHLPGATDDQALSLFQLATSMTEDGYASLKQQTRADATPEVDSFEKFKEYLVGSKIGISDAQDEYFGQLEDTLRHNLDKVDKHGLLTHKGSRVLTNLRETLREKGARVYDTVFQQTMAEVLAGDIKNAELSRKVAEAVAEKVAVEKTKALSATGDRLTELLNEGGIFTTENVLHSGDPLVQAAISVHYAKAEGKDPSKAADGQTITADMVREHLKAMSRDEQSLTLARTESFVATLKGHEFDVPRLRKVMEENTAMAAAKIGRATAAQAGDSPETIQKLRDSAIQNFITAIMADKQLADIGTYGGRSLQQMSGKELTEAFSLNNALRDSLETMLKGDNSITVAQLSAFTTMIRDQIVNKTEGSKSKAVKTRIANLKVAADQIATLAEQNPNATLPELQASIGRIDAGIYDGILGDFMNAMNDPELVSRVTQQIRDSKFGLAWGIAKELGFNNMLSNLTTPMTSLMSGGIGQFQVVMEKALGPLMFDNDVRKTGISTNSWKKALSGIFNAWFTDAPSWNSFWNESAIAGGLKVAVGTQKQRTLVTENRIESQSVFEPSIKSDTIARKGFGAESWEAFTATKGWTNLWRFAGKVLDVGGFVIRTPSRLLEGTDELAERTAYGSSIREQMAAWVEATGLDPSKLTNAERIEMSDRATEEARVVTFKEDLKRNDGWFLKAANGLEDLRKDLPALHLLLPFFRVGVNVAYRFATANPITAQMTKYHKEAMKSGDARRIMEADARLLMGSVVTYAAVLLASAGLITGGEPMEPKERELWYAAGNQPYSIRLGDTWVGYQRTDPIASFLQMAANLTQAAGSLRDKDMGEGFATLLGVGLKSTFDKTFFKGINGVCQAIYDPNSSAAGAALESSISMFVPATSLVRAFSSDVQNSVYTGEGVINRILAKHLGALAAGQNVTAKRTMLGDPIQNARQTTRDVIGGPAGFIGAMTLPTEFRSVNGEPVYEELYRLKSKGHKMPIGETQSLTFRTPEGKVAAQRDLMLNEQERFKEIRGQEITIKGKTLKTALTSLFASPAYLTLDDEDKAKLIERVQHGYTESARVQLVREFPEIIRRR